MQFELRTQVIEPSRKTFTNLVERYGDRPASRYEEGSIDIQPVENFHYRPLYAPDKWQYDPAWSAFKLADPYTFIDPRQLYYAPYVQSRAAMNDAFAKSLEYVDSRKLMSKLPGGWDAMVGEVFLPIRHYEAGCQLVYMQGARFAYGTTLDQVCTWAAFDRIGNAQNISRVGIVYADGHDHALATAKDKWMNDAALQGMRRLIEQTMATEDWAEGLLVVDLTDRLLYDLLYTFLDEAALLGGAGGYSLMAQHSAAWFADQRRWVDQLIKVWLSDAEYGASNKAAFDAVLAKRWAQIVEAVTDVAAAIDARVDVGAVKSVEANAAAVAADLAAAGLTVPGGK